MEKKEFVVRFKNYVQEENTVHTMIDALSMQLAKKIDNCIVHGLERKGYVFNNKQDLDIFIKENCRAEVYQQTTRYFVNDIPFLEYIKNDPNKVSSITNLDHKVELRVDFATITYL